MLGLVVISADWYSVYRDVCRLVDKNWGDYYVDCKDSL